MVSASPAAVEIAPRPTADQHAELTKLLAGFPANPFTPPALRVDWLLNVAVQLDGLGYTAEASTARDRARVIVRAVIGQVAGSGD